MRRLMVRCIVAGILFVGAGGYNFAQTSTLTATVWADEAFSVYVSTSEVVDGSLFLEGDGGGEDAKTGNVELVSGVTHYLHVRVKNGGGDPCALIGSFTVGDEFMFSTGSRTAITRVETDQWRLSRDGFGPPYEFIEDLGPNGSSPWGTKTISGQAPNYIGSEDGPGDCYFSLVISPAAFLTSGNRYEYVILTQPFGGTSDSLELPLVGVWDVETYRSISVTDPGRVGVRADASVDGAARDDSLVAVAEFDLGDFVFAAPGNEETVDVSLNLHVQGNLTAGAGNSEVTEENSMASAGLRLVVQVNEETAFTGRVIYEASQAVISRNPGTYVGSDLTGFLEPLLPERPDGDAGDFQAEFNYDLDEMITTPVYTVPTGEPVRISLEIEGAATASSDGSRARASMHSTLHFPYEGPVFNLPDGFTVDAPSASVLDNRFEGVADSGARGKDLVPGLFMQAGDIVGEVQVEGREDWIALEEVSSSLFRLAQLSGRGGNYATFEDVAVTKFVDKSSPKLMEALVQRIDLEELTIAKDTQITEELWRRFEFLLNNVSITEYGLGDDIEGAIPLERFAFSYETINWLYELCDDSGISQGRVEAFWNVATNTGGSSSKSGDNEPPSVGQVGNQVVDPASSNFVDLLLDDTDTDLEDLQVTVFTSRPDLIGELQVTGSGADRKVSYSTSSLRSGVGAIYVTISDGKDSRSTSIPVLVDVEMTPYEGYLAAYFDEEEREDLDLTSPIRDPDNDNMSTLIEFLLGLNPREYNNASEAIGTVFEDTPEGRQLNVAFRKRLDDPNIQGFLWGSFDMKTWQRLDNSNPIYEETNQQGENPLFEETSGTVTLPPGTEPFFLRYQVTDVF